MTFEEKRKNQIEWKEATVREGLKKLDNSTGYLDGIIAFINDVLEGKETLRGKQIILTGQTGTGKTELLAILSFVRQIEYLTSNPDKQYTFCFPQREKNLCSDFQLSSIHCGLFIDDVGMTELIKRKGTVQGSDEYSKYYHAVDTAYNMVKHDFCTVISTNHSKKELGKIMGLRIVDRLWNGKSIVYDFHKEKSYR